jgi:E3 ubiquitin-protein ligase MYCBP2
VRGVLPGILRGIYVKISKIYIFCMFQIVAIMRRVLPDVKPQVLANLLSVPALPPKDYSILSVAPKEDGDSSFDPQQPCILDVFLACIAKALTVQVGFIFF